MKRHFDPSTTVQCNRLCGPFTRVNRNANLTGQGFVNLFLWQPGTRKPASCLRQHAGLVPVAGFESCPSWLVVSWARGPARHPNEAPPANDTEVWMYGARSEPWAGAIDPDGTPTPPPPPGQPCRWLGRNLLVSRISSWGGVVWQHPGPTSGKVEAFGRDAVRVLTGFLEGAPFRELWKRLGDFGPHSAEFRPNFPKCCEKCTE